MSTRPVAPQASPETPRPDTEPPRLEAQSRPEPKSRSAPKHTPSKQPGVVYDDLARRPGRRNPTPPLVEVRRARRVLRRVDSWSVFRFSIVLYGCALVVFLSAAVGLWVVASAAGAIPSIENFITQLFALKKFHFKAAQLFLGTLGVGVVGVFVATLFTVVTGVLYNLISDVVGGVEFTVLEEEPLNRSV